MYRVEYSSKAQKVLKKMQKHKAVKIYDAFDRIAGGDTKGLDIEPLEGRDGFRLKIYAYRALYTMNEDKLVITVVKVGARGDIYK